MAKSKTKAAPAATPRTGIHIGISEKDRQAIANGLSRLLADIPRTFATPEIRVDCPDETKFEVVKAAVEWFGARYPVNNIDGVRMTFPKGWGLIRASNTQPVLVLRFEASDAASRDEYQAEVLGWLAGRV